MTCLFLLDKHFQEEDIAEMNINPQPANLLENLRDIHMPAPISAWPPGPGWIFLLVIFTLIATVTCIIILKNYKVWQTRKHALHLLKKYKKQYPKIINSQRACSLVNELLKKTAFYYYPRTKIASLSGADWIKFLNVSIQHPSIIQKIFKSTNKLPSFNEVQQELLEYPYQSSKNINLDKLFKTAHTWIKNQKHLNKKQRESLCSK